jgi:hypothetical protein
MRSIFNAFTAGEIAPEIIARSDLERYELGAKTLQNFVVRYTGGAWKRPGTRFVSSAFSGADARLYTFRLSDAADESFIAIFGNLTMWLFKDEVLIATLTTPFLVADVRTLQFSQKVAEIRITHPSYPRQLLKLTGATWSVGALPPEGCTPLAQTPTIDDSGAYIRYIRVLRGGSGYADSDTITLSGSSGSGFQGVPTFQGGAITGVSIIEEGRGYAGVSITTTSPGGGSGATFEIGLSPTIAGYVVTVTAVYTDGTESGPMRPAVMRNSIDFTQTLGSSSYSWTAVPDAIYYRVFRSIVVPDGTTIHAGFAAGFIGDTRGTTFNDNNITPDFTLTPSIYRNPYANKGVIGINVTTPGTGYSDTSTVTMADDDGSGFTGYPVVLGGVIVGMVITNPGSGYTDPTLTLSGGSGAVFDIRLTPGADNNPAAVTKFQQRLVYAGSLAEPITVRATRADECQGFNENVFLTDSDPYEYTLDVDAVTPIKFIQPARQGLLIFTTAGVSMLRAADGVSVSASSGVLDPQSAYGISSIAPVSLGEDIAYIQALNRGMRLLIYDANARQFEGREISVLASHFFNGRGIRALAFGLETNKIGYGVYEDGSMFSVTIDRNQEVFAFTPLWTQGRVLDVVSVISGSFQQIYLLVLRVIDGVDKLVLEALREDAPKWIDDEVHLDASLQILPVYPAATITVSATTGVVVVTATSDVFTGTLDQAFVAQNARGNITRVISATQVEVTLVRDFDTIKGQRNIMRFPANEWWIAPYATTVTGIPLEGQIVSVVGDGKQQGDKLVTGGTITLDDPAAIVHVGLPFTALMETVPPQIVEGSRYRSTSAVLLTGRAGAFTVDGYDAVKRTTEPWAASTDLTGKSESIILASGWGDAQSIEVYSDNALPCQILRIVFSYDEGDYETPRKR